MACLMWGRWAFFNFKGSQQQLYQQGKISPQSIVTVSCLTCGSCILASEVCFTDPLNCPIIRSLYWTFFCPNCMLTFQAHVRARFYRFYNTKCYVCAPHILNATERITVLCMQHTLTVVDIFWFSTLLLHVKICFLFHQQACWSEAQWACCRSTQ